MHKQWDYYYNKASQEYERKMFAPYDYYNNNDNDVKSDIDYDETTTEVLMEDLWLKQNT